MLIDYGPITIALIGVIGESYEIQRLYRDNKSLPDIDHGREISRLLRRNG